ncbi:substrate binding subunit of ER-derived-lipid transporter [Chloropicon roscoffensis]|uniref:Substrate binding subunit of ER-derived-lipid transporter n=1 Tax=Chloropicon roscoffensis TaxID=1461544 RepID=A0AAX4PH78_9CHLO
MGDVGGSRVIRRLPCAMAGGRTGTRAPRPLGRGLGVGAGLGHERRSGRAATATRRALGKKGGDEADESGSPSSSGGASFLKPYLASIVKTLQDFGVGRRSIWEGGVGLFIVGTIGAVFALISWVVGTRPGRYLTSYNFTVAFPVAYGLSIGTPVRMRGVNIGQVVGIRPHVTSVDAVVQIKDEKIAIPRDAKIEINQLGLIAETMIDITPKPDSSEDYKSSPLDADCAKEGSLVCHRAEMKGDQGVSMDEFILISTKLVKEMEKGGMDTMLAAAGQAIDIIERSKPLLKEATLLAKEVTPILHELNKQNVVGTVEELLSLASKSVTDINNMNKVILTEENLVLLRQSVGTLVNTLKNIESISGSVSGLTGDSATQANIKQLIQSLSRIIVD